MIILFDVGNSNITIGIADLEKVKRIYRLKTLINKTADEYYISIKEMISCQEVKAIVISSVVPELIDILTEISVNYFNVQPLVFSNGIKTGIQIITDNPKEVGSDIIADAVGSLSYGNSVLVVDLGTATKYIYVKNKAFHGCAIAPGVNVALKALVSSASLLPSIDIKTPKTVIGKNTITSMQSGITYATASQVDGMIRRIKEEVKDENLVVVATGGLAPTIIPLCKENIICDKNLTLDGMLEVYKKNL